MINQDEFKTIRDKMESDEKLREQIIQKSRDIIKSSKVIIYSVHREDMEKAKSELDSIKDMIKNLPTATFHVGIKEVAYQEYVEALSLYTYAKENRLITFKESEVDQNNYLLGLCDLTGELMRMAVNKTIKGEYDSVYKIRELINDIYGEFLQFNLPNGELRKKSDSIKWNLNKVDEIVYNLKLKSN